MVDGRVHTPKVVGSSPTPATIKTQEQVHMQSTLLNRKVKV